MNERSRIIHVLCPFPHGTVVFPLPATCRVDSSASMNLEVEASTEA